MEKIKNSLIKNYELVIRLLSTTQGLTVALGVIAAASILFHWAGDANTPSPKAPSPSQTADTYIPSGFVLVPIEIQNIEGLDSILGQFGVVDLFLPAIDGQKHGRLIARRLKILRAPLNPNQFAVLAPEEQAPLIVQNQGPYFAVIQNPKETGTRFVKEKNQRSRISFDQVIE